MRGKNGWPLEWWALEPFCHGLPGWRRLKQLEYLIRTQQLYDHFFWTESP